MKNWICDTEEDPVTGEVIVQLPSEFTFFMDWRSGDRLDYNIKDNQVIVRNLDAEIRDKNRTNSP